MYMYVHAGTIVLIKKCTEGIINVYVYLYINIMITRGVYTTTNCTTLLFVSVLVTPAFYISQVTRVQKVKGNLFIFTF